MKKQILLLLVIFALIPKSTITQTLDTIVNVGNNHKMHFTIIKGKRSPILFEAGFGNGADVWKNITKQIAQVTEATVITYDRLSYGENKKNFQIGLENETKALETGLEKLGYSNKNSMLVGHSLGGMYISYYASRHPNNVKSMVLIDDANVCSLTDYYKKVKLFKEDTIENYIANILSTVIKNPIPKNIPLMDIVADTHFDDNGNPDTVWLSCHKQFVAQSPNRKLLLAYNVSHHIFYDNPSLVINVIVTQYANFTEPNHKVTIIEKGYALVAEIDNERNKNEVKCGHSEDDLNTWAYSLLEKNETEKAIEIFELNVTLNPNAWNTYDSLAEAYLKANNKELAIKNYKKSLELNPKNDNATKVLSEIK